MAASVHSSQLQIRQHASSATNLAYVTLACNFQPAKARPASHQPESHARHTDSICRPWSGSLCRLSRLAGGACFPSWPLCSSLVCQRLQKVIRVIVCVERLVTSFTLHPLTLIDRLHCPASGHGADVLHAMRMGAGHEQGLLLLFQQSGVSKCVLECLSQSKACLSDAGLSAGHSWACMSGVELARAILTTQMQCEGTVAGLSKHQRGHGGNRLPMADLSPQGSSWGRQWYWDICSLPAWFSANQLSEESAAEAWHAAADMLRHTSELLATWQTVALGREKESLTCIRMLRAGHDQEGHWGTMRFGNITKVLQERMLKCHRISMWGGT